MSNYRIIISYSEGRHCFIANAPELPGCEAEGGTRSEAVSKLEEEMVAQIENMKSQSLELPQPIDDQQFDGNLSLKISSALHRDLTFLAKLEAVNLEVLLTELLTRGLNQRWGGGRAARPRPEGRDRFQEGQGQRYHEIMDNRADFIEYVRSLEGAGTHRDGGRGKRRGPR